MWVFLHLFNQQLINQLCVCFYIYSINYVYVFQSITRLSINQYTFQPLYQQTNTPFKPFIQPTHSSTFQPIHSSTFQPFIHSTSQSTNQYTVQTLHSFNLSTLHSFNLSINNSSINKPIHRSNLIHSISGLSIPPSINSSQHEFTLTLCPDHHHHQHQLNTTFVLLLSMKEAVVEEWMMYQWRTNRLVCLALVCVNGGEVEGVIFLVASREFLSCGFEFGRLKLVFLC